jgi:hypothetical protein
MPLPPLQAIPRLTDGRIGLIVPPTFFPVGFDEIKNLPYPDGIDKRKRSNWTTKQKKAVGRYEGIPIALEGFLALVKNKNKKIEGARPEGKESCNCHSAESDQIDFHIWLLNSPEDDRSDAIVVEAAPRVRIHHPDWTVANLTDIAKNKQQVRISGWLMLDQEHPEQVGDTRTTLWEIHPIMKIEYQEGGSWKTLK